jgi:hypothetical protein
MTSRTFEGTGSVYQGNNLLGLVPYRMEVKRVGKMLSTSGTIGNGGFAGDFLRLLMQDGHSLVFSTRGNGLFSLEAPIIDNEGNAIF